MNTTPCLSTQETPLYFLDVDITTAIHSVGATYEACGSRVTCHPAPTDTDRDYLVEVPYTQKAVADIVGKLSGLGFKWEGSQHYQDAAGDFMSWRFDHLNLIVTANTEFARRHRAATRVCKALNILDKPHRIAIFQGILYGDRKTEQPQHVRPAPAAAERAVLSVDGDHGCALLGVNLQEGEAEFVKVTPRPDEHLCYAEQRACYAALKALRARVGKPDLSYAWWPRKPGSAGA